MDELKKYLPNISFGTVIIVFFLPFLSIKCEGEEIANPSGIQLVMGTEIEAEKIDPNIFAIISFLSAIIGLIVVYGKIKKWKKVGLVLSIIGLIGLILLYNNANSALKEEGMVMNLGVGFYLAFLAYLVNSIFLGLKVKGDKTLEE